MPAGGQKTTNQQSETDAVLVQAARALREGLQVHGVEVAEGDAPVVTDEGVEGRQRCPHGP